MKKSYTPITKQIVVYSPSYEGKLKWGDKEVIKVLTDAEIQINKLAREFKNANELINSLDLYSCYSPDGCFSFPDVLCEQIFRDTILYKEFSYFQDVDLHDIEKKIEEGEIDSDDFWDAIDNEIEDNIYDLKQEIKYKFKEINEELKNLKK